MLNPSQFNEQNPIQYGPQIRPKENSQGTLFRVHKSQRTPESRQPRGYSPERIREITSKTGMADYKTGKFSGTWTDIPDNGGLFHTKDVQQVAETIARSTVPMSALDNLRIMPGSRSIGSGSDYPSTAGVYEKNTALGPVIKIARHKGTGATAIHEIGHHVNKVNFGKPTYGNSEDDPDYGMHEMLRGKDEGSADKYADTHAREPGYKRLPHVNPSYGDFQRPDDWHAGYGIKDFGRQEAFNNGYIAARYGNKDYFRNVSPEQWKAHAFKADRLF